MRPGIRNGAASAATKDTRTLSRAVERIENEITNSLSSHRASKSWATTTLIQDELILSHSARFQSNSEEIISLQLEGNYVLRKLENLRGWPPGMLATKMSSL